MKYVALLRGINVAGQKKIKMVELTKLFEGLKFKNVQTYIQSGNVVFEYHEWKTEPLVAAIEKAIQKACNFEVSVILRTEKDWPKVIKSNPFLKKKGIDEARLYVAFLRDSITRKNFPELEVYRKNKEELVVAGREIYLHYPAGFGTTKLTNQVFEKKLETVATTRNWNTLNALQEMLR